MKVNVAPDFLTKILIERYIDDKFSSGIVIENDKASKKDFANALRRFLWRQTDEDFKNLLNEYAEAEGLKEITFKENDWEAECSKLIKIIKEKEQFKKLHQDIINNAGVVYNWLEED